MVIKALLVEAGLRVVSFRLEDLGALVRAQRADDTVHRAVATVLRGDLVVAEDIGLLEVGTDAAEGLSRLVEGAYEKLSVVMFSNLHRSGLTS